MWGELLVLRALKLAVVVVVCEVNDRHLARGGRQLAVLVVRRSRVGGFLELA